MNSIILFQCYYMLEPLRRVDFLFSVNIDDRSIRMKEEEEDAINGYFKENDLPLD